MGLFKDIKIARDTMKIVKERYLQEHPEELQIKPLNEQKFGYNGGSKYLEKSLIKKPVGKPGGTFGGGTFGKQAKKPNYK